MATDYDNTPPLTCQCLHFLSCIKGKAEPQTGLHDISWVMKVLDLSEQSLKKGARVYFSHAGDADESDKVH
jgi:hypothetical protein